LAISREFPRVVLRGRGSSDTPARTSQLGAWQAAAGPARHDGGAVITPTNLLLFGILAGVLLSRPGRRMLGAAVTFAIRVAAIGAIVVIAYAAIEIIQTSAPVLVRLSPDMRFYASAAIVAAVVVVCTMRLQYEKIGD
jgi:hypothetical protein